MLRLFHGKNGGVISTMLALMMVAILGISSVLVELGRFQSSSAIFDEAAQSSGFSTIACKNENLLKNYGLLAIDGSTNLNETAIKYLKSNLGGSESSAFNVESLMEQIDDVTAEGIYSLNESEVLKRQILEVSKYRGPITILDETIDIDTLLSSLSGAFSGLTAISSFANKASATIAKLTEFVVSVKGIVEAINELSESNNTYDIAYGDLVKAIKERDKLADAKDIKDPPVNPEEEKEEEKYKNENGDFDQEKFDAAVKEYNEKLLPEYNEWKKKNKKLNEVIDKIDGKEGEKGLKEKYIDAAKDTQEKYKAFMTAADSVSEDFGDLLSGGLDECYDNLIRGVKNSKQDDETKKELVEQYKKQKENAKKELNKNKGAVSDFCDVMQSFRDSYTEVKTTEVTTYLENRTAADIDLNTFKNKHQTVNLWGLVDNLISKLKTDFAGAVIDKIVKFVETLIDTVGKLVKVLSYVTGDGMFSDPTFDVKINDSTWNIIQSNHSSQKSSISSHNAEDKALSEEKRNEAGAPETDSDSIMDQLNVQMNTMVEGIQQVTNAAKGIDSKLTEDSKLVKVLTKITGLDKLISAYNVIKNLGSFLDGIKKTITAAIKIATIVLSNLVDIIYDNILVNTYATEMFRNRTSSDSDETMLGVAYKDIQRGLPNSAMRNQVRKWIADTPSFSFLQETSISKQSDYAFAGAEAEYIFAGKQSEIENQKSVGMCILIIRMLSNIPAVFTNKEATEAMAAVGPFAPLVFILFWLGETGLDMLFLTNGVAVPLVKIGDMCFLSAEGLKNLADKVAELGNVLGQKEFFDKVSGVIAGEDSANKNLKIEKNSKTGAKELVYKGAKDSLKKTLDNIIEFDYGEHLWLLLCFVSNKTKVRRIGDLIQMQMNAKDGNNEFRLTEAYTYVRIESKANFQPLIPIPGVSDQITLKTIKYVGY